MEEQRPAEDLVETVARLARELEDLKSTSTIRANRRPTGDFEATFRTAPKPDTLLLNGQTVSRETYAALWAWVQEQGLVIAGMFTNGDGSTTFGLPNLAGRLLVAAGTLGADTYALGAQGGASSKLLVTANMPAHDHNVAVNAVGTHSHAMSTGGGGHGGHFPGSSFTAAAGSDLGLAAWNSGGTSLGHSHSGGIVSDGGHGHTVTEASVGGTTPVNVMPPYQAVNYLLWT